MPTRLNIYVPPPDNPDAPPPRRLINLPRLGREPSIAEQNEAHHNKSLDLEPNSVIREIEDLPRIKLAGKEYILESLLHMKRNRTSFVYNKDNGYGLIEWPSKKPFWACKRCDDKGNPKIFVATSTGNPRKPGSVIEMEAGRKAGSRSTMWNALAR